MSVEAKRGCGYRKVGGLYIVGDAIIEPCDRLPIPLGICPCCGGGVKFTRGWTWIQPYKLFDGDHIVDCTCYSVKNGKQIPPCPICNPARIFGGDGKAGILWIGAQFYKTPKDFLDEGASLGVSRRIRSMPRGFKVGETWVFFAHNAAVTRLAEGGQSSLFDGIEGSVEFLPGIFSAFKPSRIERIVKDSEFALYDKALYDFIFLQVPDNFRESIDGHFTEEEVEIILRLRSDVERGITLVPVPDNDPDHCSFAQ